MNNPPPTRAAVIQALFPSAPAYRVRQAEAAVFDTRISSWAEATALPQEMRAKLTDELPWLYVKPVTTVSGEDGTSKALLELGDGNRIETVLMANSRGSFTVCVSSQVGCGMKCAFCATGQLGLARSLTSDEIVDQYRYWAGHLIAKNDERRISNIVFMGMGEPMANYENVRAALNAILKNTDIGTTRITVSSVGLVPRLEALIDDPEWPPVRIAISLHCADQLTRKQIMPTTTDDFLDRLAAWANRFTASATRRQHLTFEYVLLAGVNDSPQHADLLAHFSGSAGRARINLIPFNATDSYFQGSDEEATRRFQEILLEHGVDVTRRRSLGQDIMAACGQLAGKDDKPKTKTQKSKI